MPEQTQNTEKVLQSSLVQIFKVWISIVETIPGLKLLWKSIAQIPHVAHKLLTWEIQTVSLNLHEESRDKGYRPRLWGQKQRDRACF